MFYLTEDWYADEILSYADVFIRADRRADKANENFYAQIYNEKRREFIAEEESDILYRDPRAELEKLEKLAAASGISTDERESRRRFAAEFKLLYAKRIEDGKFYKFDEELAGQRFDGYIEFFTAVYRRLPSDISERITDVRLLALGYASAEVKKLLKPYCAALRKKNRGLKSKARAETAAAFKRLAHAFDLTVYEGAFLTEIEEREDGVFLNFDGGNKITVKNGKIKQVEKPVVYRYDEDSPFSGWSMAESAELRFRGGVFALNILLLNADERGGIKVCRLTVEGTDVEEICPIGGLF